MHKHDMPDEAKEGLQAMKDNRQGIVFIVSVIVVVAVSLLAGRGLLFGLVMATVFHSGLTTGSKISEALAKNAPDYTLPGKIVGAIVVGIITAVIITVIRGVVGESINVMAEDNIIIQVIKYFFDMNASIAVGAGALAGAFLHGTGSE